MAQTPAERRAAQRQLAKDLKARREGKKVEILPKSITHAARTKEQIIHDIQKAKNERFASNPRFNQRRSDKAVRMDPESKQPRTINQLRKIDKVLRDAKRTDDYSAIYYNLAADEDDLESALYYK